MAEVVGTEEEEEEEGRAHTRPSSSNKQPGCCHHGTTTTTATTRRHLPPSPYAYHYTEQHICDGQVWCTSIVPLTRALSHSITQNCCQNGRTFSSVTSVVRDPLPPASSAYLMSIFDSFPFLSSSVPRLTIGSTTP